MYRNVFALKLHNLVHLPFFIMSTELMVAALRRGQNGNEILQILDAITSDDNSSTESAGPAPTLDPVEF